jgi:hypothetical protein
MIDSAPTTNAPTVRIALSAATIHPNRLNSRSTGSRKEHRQCPEQSGPEHKQEPLRPVAVPLPRVRPVTDDGLGHRRHYQQTEVNPPSPTQVSDIAGS